MIGDHTSQLSNILPSPFTRAIPDASGGEIAIGRKSNNINLTNDFIVMDDVLIPRPDQTKLDQI
jgi:hypothetical protein